VSIKEEEMKTHVKINLVGSLRSRALPEESNNVASNANWKGKVDFEEALGCSCAMLGCSYWGNGNVGLSDEDEDDKDETDP